GIVTFISASSFLEGAAFVGLRETLRRQCDEVWIIDLGGEGRGTRRDENVFAIQTPVAITLAVRYGSAAPTTPAIVRYHRIAAHEREGKLAALDAIADFADIEWRECP